MNTPINKNLQNAAQDYSGKASHPLNNAFIAGAKWQEEQSKYEMFDDLEEELKEWMEYGPHTNFPWCTIPDAIEITARHFANWQKEQDKETIEVAEDHAMFAGRIQMKEELEKDAISCSVDENSPFLFLDYNPEQEHNYLQSKGFKPGDKVKVIVIKEN